VNVIGDVGLHVTHNSLDIVGRCLGRDGVEDNFITSQEGQCIIIPREHVHNTEYVLQVQGSVCSPWLLIIQMLVFKRSVDVQNQVDTSSSEYRHTLVMVLARIYGVDSNCVDTEFLEEIGITSTLITVGQGVSALLDTSGTTRLVINTFDLYNTNQYIGSKRCLFEGFEDNIRRTPSRLRYQ